MRDTRMHLKDTVLDLSLQGWATATTEYCYDCIAGHCSSSCGGAMDD